MTKKVKLRAITAKKTAKNFSRTKDIYEDRGRRQIKLGAPKRAGKRR